MAKDAYITSNGIKIHLLILESQPNSPVLIFLHATGFYAEYYNTLLTLLNERGFTVIGLDLQGHGRSEGKRGDFILLEAVQNVRDTVTFAIKNYNDKVGIIGTSQGGIISLYSLCSDKRLKSAVCHCAAILSERQADCIIPARAKILKHIVRLAGRFTKRMRMNLWTYIDRYTFYIESQKLKDLKKDPLFVRTYTVRSLYSLATSSPPGKIENIKTPVMFIHPECDGIFPVEYIRSIFDKLTCHKRFEIIPGMRHMFLAENPDTAIDILDSWLKETLK